MIKRRGLLFVISSPSGSGKTTIIKEILNRDSCVKLSISATTRPQRLGEVQGKDYFFVSIAEFQAMVLRDEFIEYAEIFGHYYGTPKNVLDLRIQNGEDTLFDIDWQGAQHLSHLYPNDIVRIFIMPPSLQELEKRLRARALDDENTILHRMSKALREISHCDEYDYVILNDDLINAIEDAKSVMRSERCKRQRLNLSSYFIHEEKGDPEKCMAQLI